MTYLELVQRLHYEARLPGSPPSAVTGQSGRAADLVRWVSEAYNDIQRMHGGRWKWLRKGFTLDTTADDIDYAYTDADDDETAAAITRFRAWDFRPKDPPHIYLVSDGVATERELYVAEWDVFRRTYLLGTHDSAYPYVVGVDDGNVLHLGPTPDGIYRVTGHYWRSNQVLAADNDEPEMPEDYHMLIVWNGIIRYGYSVVAADILATAQTMGQPLYEGLVGDQAFAASRLRLGGALA